MIEMIQMDMMDIIVREVANYYNLDLAKMISNDNEERYERPRKIAIYLCSNIARASRKSISELLRMHTWEVFIKCPTPKDKSFFDPKIRKDIASIEMAVLKADDWKPCLAKWELDFIKDSDEFYETNAEEARAVYKSLCEE